jgi:hypothetical protein
MNIDHNGMSKYQHLEEQLNQARVHNIFFGYAHTFASLLTDEKYGSLLDNIKQDTNKIKGVIDQYYESMLRVVEQLKMEEQQQRQQEQQQPQEQTQQQEQM